MNPERLGLALLLFTVSFVTNCVNVKICKGGKRVGVFSPFKVQYNTWEDSAPVATASKKAA